MHYLEKNKFFKRKNRKRLYAKYEADYNNFVDLCFRYKKALDRLDHTISKNISKYHIYTFLTTIRLDAASYRCQAISYTYQNTIDLPDTVATVEDYEDLLIKTEQLSSALSKIYTALELVTYIENRGLDFIIKEDN